MSEIENNVQLNTDSGHIRLSLKQIIKIVLLIISVVMFLVILFIRTDISNSLVDQQADLRWSNGANKASQVSVFMKHDAVVDDITIGSLRHAISVELKQYLDNEKYLFEEEDPFAGPFTVASSGLGHITISVDDLGMSSNEVSAYGITGDFFIFHPVNLIAGRYFNDSDADDSIILDSHSAYNLFGSADCLGMPVYIGKKPYYVRGVYEPEDSRLYKKAQANMGFVFIPFSGLKAADDLAKITSIEVVAIEPYKDFMYGFLKDSTKSTLAKDSYITVANTDRFKFDSLIANVISEWGARSMVLNGINYPYWENVARGVEDIEAGLLAFQGISLFIIIVIVTSYILYAINHSEDEMKTLGKKLSLLTRKSHKEHVVLAFIVILSGLLFAGCGKNEGNKANVIYKAQPIEIDEVIDFRDFSVQKYDEGFVLAGKNNLNNDNQDFQYIYYLDFEGKLKNSFGFPLSDDAISFVGSDGSVYLLRQTNGESPIEVTTEFPEPMVISEESDGVREIITYDSDYNIVSDVFVNGAKKEDSEETDGTEETEGIEDTDVIEGTEGIEDTDVIEETEGTENAEAVETSEDSASKPAKEPTATQKANAKQYYSLAYNSIISNKNPVNLSYWSLFAPLNSVPMGNDINMKEAKEHIKALGIYTGESESEDNYNEDNVFYYELNEISPSGELVKVVNINNDKTIVDSKMFDESPNMGFRVIGDSSGLYLYSYEYIVELDYDLNVLNVKSNSDTELRGADYVLDKNGEINVCVSKSGHNVYFGKADFSTGKMLSSDIIPGERYYTDAYRGTASDILIVKNANICGYSRGDKETQVLVDLSASGISTDYVRSVMQLDDKHFVCIYSSLDDDINHASILVQDSQTGGNGGKKTITLASMGNNTNIKKAISVFNKNNKEYSVQMVDYYALYAGESDNGYEAALEKLNTDIIAGNMPDILIVDSELPFNTYINKGLIEDLYPWFDKDEEYSLDKFDTEILEVFANNGKLYRLPPTYTMISLAVKDKFVDGKTTMTGEEMIEAFRKSGCKLFTTPSQKAEILNSVFLAANSQFIDEDNATCDFNSDAFRNLISFLDIFPDKTNDAALEDFYMNRFDTAYREDYCFASVAYISDISSYQRLVKGSFGEDVTFIGFPAEDGLGSSVYCNESLAMSSKTENKEGCWEFIKYFISDEYQKSLNWGIPIRKSAYEAKAAKMKDKLYSEYTYEGVMRRYPEVFYLNGEAVELPPMTDEELDKFYSILHSVEQTADVDPKVINIVKEECGSYFNKNSTVDEIANRIQSRVQIYLFETQ